MGQNEKQKLTTRVLRQSVPAGARGSRAAAKSHTFIFLQRQRNLFYKNTFLDIKQAAKIPASDHHPDLCLCILKRTEKRQDFDGSMNTSNTIPLHCSVAAYNRIHQVCYVSCYVQLHHFRQTKHIQNCRWLSFNILEKYC